MVERVIALLPGSAAAEQVALCFDCPTPSSVFETLAVFAAMSIIFAIPGFFIGLLLHRTMSRISLPGRLAMVGLSVPCFWYVFFAAVSTGWADAEAASLSQPLEHMLFVGELLVGGVILAVAASSFDARRVRAAQSGGYYSRY